MEQMKQSELSNVLNLELKNHTGQQIIFDIRLEDLKYREEFFKGIKILLERGLTYNDVNIYNQIFELYETLSSKNQEYDLLELSVNKDGVNFLTTGVSYSDELGEDVLFQKEMSTDKDSLMQYLSSLESVDDLDISMIPNSYFLEMEDIYNIYDSNLIKDSKKE